MIKFEHTEVVGWEHAIRRIRNTLGNCEESDSVFLTLDGDYHDIVGNTGPWEGKIDDYNSSLIGEKDHDLIMRLRDSDPSFMQLIIAYVDITAPLSWWQQFPYCTLSSCQTRTLALDYLSLANLYKVRKDKVCYEYNANFINWIESLPYSEIITGKEKKERTEMDEKQFLLDYAANHDLRVINARLRLRALWTAYLLRQNLFFDRKSGMNDLWNAAKLTSWTDDFDEFQAFMNIYFQ